MTLHLDVFGHQFKQAQQQLAELLQQAEQDHGPKTLLTQALDELTNALEEVQVLSEELSEQYIHLQAAQASLTTERQQYFELFELAPDGYIVTDTKGIIQQINQVATTLLNRHQRSPIGKPLAVMIHPADIHGFYTLLSRLQQGEAFRNVSLRLQPYQKQTLHTSFTIAPIQDQQDQLVGFRWLFRDLTQQRRAGIALEESEAKYRAIVEDQTELICRFLADGRLTFVNQAFCQYFERSSESLIGERFFELIGETVLEKKLMQLATLDRLDQSHSVISFEHQVAMPDGEMRWQEWDHRALFDRNGDFFQFQSVGRDITDLKLTEKALDRREAQLRLATDALPALLTYINNKQQVICVNRQNYGRWLGPSWADMMGDYLWDVLGPNAYQQIRVQVEAALSGEFVNFNWEVTLPNQEPFWVTATFAPDQTEDGPVEGFFVVIKKINIDNQTTGYASDGE